MTHEPGSPFLSGVSEALERFADADALARRVHQLRQGRGLDCEAAAGSLDGAPMIPCVLIWLAPAQAANGRAASDSGEKGPRELLAAAAGPGADRPADLLAALGRTAIRRAA